MRMRISLIVLISIINYSNGAPAPIIETIWQTATQVMNEDGSIFTFLDGLFDSNPTTAAAVSTIATQSSPVTAAALPATITDAAAAATSGSSSGSSLGSSGFNLDSLLSSSFSKWLSYFGFGNDNEDTSGSTTNTAITTSAQAAAATTSSANNLFPAFSWPNKGSTTQAATTPISTSSAPAYTQTSTPATTSTSSTSGSTEVGGSDPSFALAILDSHNQYRAQHDAPSLTWDEGAYQYAQNNADNYDCSGVLTHTHGQYGENLAAGFKDGPSAVKAWYDEGETYSYSDANTYDHFTQVVWKGSTGVGCAYKDCSSKNWGLYVVCEYNPPGNVIGKNRANVLPASSS